MNHIEQLALEIAAQEDVVSQLDPKTDKHAEETAKLAEMKAQQAAMQAQESISSKFDSIDLGDGMVVSLRDICTSEKWAQMLSAWIQTQIGDQAQTHATVVASYESKINAQNESIAELEERVEELLKVQASATRLQMVVEDLEAKRNAASEQLAEAKAENERLEKDNESLREQLAKRAVLKTNAPTTDELRELARQARAEEEAAKPGYYNKRWSTKENGMEDRRYYTITLSATGEDINVPQLEIGKYREETPGEAERFRQEQARVESERLASETLDQSLAVPEVQFPGTDAALPADATDGEMDDTPVARREFVALAERVKLLEQQAYRVAV